MFIIKTDNDINTTLDLQPTMENATYLTRVLLFERVLKTDLVILLRCFDTFAFHEFHTYHQNDIKKRRTEWIIGKSKVKEGEHIAKGHTISKWYTYIKPTHQ